MDISNLYTYYMFHINEIFVRKQIYNTCNHFLVYIIFFLVTPNSQLVNNMF
uniref:Uncharacterized protein n=1 Tax=Parastrongyloides trichosuri TaxID=131310 RepID=A0A0N4ZDR8_PARTI